MEDQGFLTNSAGMRHSLLCATPLLAAVLGVWTRLSFATPTLHNGIDPVVRIVSQQQQQQRGAQALCLSPAYRRLSPSVRTSAIAKRDGIYVQHLSRNIRLHYYILTVCIPQEIPLGQDREAICSFLFPR